MSQSFGSYLRSLTACHENVNLSHETGIYSGKYTSTPAELRVYIPKPEIRALKPDVRAVKPRVRAVKPRVRAVIPDVHALNPRVRAVNVRVYFTRTDLQKTLAPHCSARI